MVSTRSPTAICSTATGPEGVEIKRARGEARGGGIGVRRRDHLSIRRDGKGPVAWLESAAFDDSILNDAIDRLTIERAVSKYHVAGIVIFSEDYCALYNSGCISIDNSEILRISLQYVRINGVCIVSEAIRGEGVRWDRGRDINGGGEYQHRLVRILGVIEVDSSRRNFASRKTQLDEARRDGVGILGFEIDLRNLASHDNLALGTLAFGCVIARCGAEALRTSVEPRIPRGCVDERPTTSSPGNAPDALTVSPDPAFAGPRSVLLRSLRSGPSVHDPSCRGSYGAPRERQLASVARKSAISPREMARPEGFEPPTHEVEARCSIQLS